MLDKLLWKIQISIYDREAYQLVSLSPESFHDFKPRLHVRAYQTSFELISLENTKRPRRFYRWFTLWIVLEAEDFIFEKPVPPRRGARTINLRGK